MIDTKSIADSNYINDILDILNNFEDAFPSLFNWSNETTETAMYVSPEMARFKNRVF